MVISPSSRQRKKSAHAAIVFRYSTGERSLSFFWNRSVSILTYPGAVKIRKVLSEELYFTIVSPKQKRRQYT